MTLTRGKAKGGARININPLKIDFSVIADIKLIQNYGSRYDWYQALVCPCTLNSQSTDLKFRKLACGLCNGTGWTYSLTKEIRAVPSNTRREEQTLTYRVPQPGIMSNIFVNLTCEPVNKVNIRDRLVFKESVTFRSEAQIFNPEKEYYQFTFPIVELMKVIDEDGKEYDCTNVLTDLRKVDSNVDGNLVWNDSSCRPPTGKAFSILYNFYPSYIVITAAHEIRGFVAGKTTAEGGVQAYEDLPRLFTAKLEIPDNYLFG